MRAIVNVNKGSFYSKFNGLTFDVVELYSNIITLQINNIKTDFSLFEVIIVDIQNEYQKSYDNYNWGSDHNTYNNLKNYCLKNDISNIKLEYNCPS